MGCGASAKDTYGTHGQPVVIKDGASASRVPAKANDPTLSSTAQCRDLTVSSISTTQSSTVQLGGDVDKGTTGEITLVRAVSPQNSPASVKIVELDKEGSNQGADQFADQEAEKMQQRALETFEAYNFFFNHIGIRKGWRKPPFSQEEVQEPFQAAAEVVAMVRTKLDREGEGGMVLRQVEGSSMNFLWGWPPERPPGESRDAFVDFSRGLIHATLSDGRGLVEGLDEQTIESYIGSHHLLSCTHKEELCTTSPDLGTGP